MSKPKPIPLQYCAGCGAILDPWPAEVPCRDCGTVEKVIEGRPGAIYSRMKTTIQGRGTKRRPEMEIVDGEEIHRNSNALQRVTRVFDRGTDRYLEQITNADGEVVRSRDEPLSEHRGHGSAKRKQIGPE